MRRLFVIAVALAALGAQAQGAPEPTGASPGAPAAKKPEKEPLDVSRLPFTPDSIRQVVAYHQDEIQACYEEFLALKDKPLEGRVMTTFTITGTGLVKGAKAIKKGTTLVDRSLFACMVSVLDAMTFPKPDDGEDHPIEFPFNLKPIK